MRYLIDFTYVHQYPEYTTGIQRVVHNVFNQLRQLKLNSGDELIPVVVRDSQVYAIETLISKDKSKATLSSLKFGIHRLVEALNRRRMLWSQIPLFSKVTLARKLLSMTYLFSVFPLRVAFRLLTVWESFLGKKARDSVIEVGDGDVMLLLDSSWHFDFEPLLQRGKSRGMKVIVVVYDLIPLSHPQFFDRRLLKQFTQWLKMVSAYADGYVTISQTVRDELQEFHSQARPLPSEAFQFFYLGAELKMPKQGLPVRAQLVQTGHERMYLTVGTLEPRKNHKYLLDAFDLLWKQGEKVHLYIIGKVGWKCEDLLERIESHAEYGRRLMFYDNANDAELVACYKAAKAVVFASHVEGFGLPLVEAWQQGTPVYASDIPVFREIGGQDTSFFDLDDPASLAAIIRADQDNEPTVNSEWINWKQSAQQLYDAADRIASIRS